MKKVEVLGPGCAKCDAAAKNVRRAVELLGLDARVEHIHDVAECAKRGVVLTPAVVVDGEVKITGRVPTVEEAKAFLSGD